MQLFQSKRKNTSETEIELTAAEIGVEKVLIENLPSSNSLDCGWVSLKSQEVRLKINSFIKVDTEYWKLAAATEFHEEDSAAGSLIHQDRLRASAEAYEYKVWKETWKDVVQNLSTHIRLILMNSNFYHLNLSDPRDGSILVAELAQLDRYSDFESLFLAIPFYPLIFDDCTESTCAQQAAQTYKPLGTTLAPTGMERVRCEGPFVNCL